MKTYTMTLLDSTVRVATDYEYFVLALHCDHEQFATLKVSYLDNCRLTTDLTFSNENVVYCQILMLAQVFTALNDKQLALEAELLVDVFDSVDEITF